MRIRSAAVPLGCIAAMLLSSQSPCLAGESRLDLAWPEHWEFRPPVKRDSLSYLQARQHREGVTLQQLSIRIIDARLAEKAIDANSIRDLTAQLRDAMLRTSVERHIPLHSLTSRKGYYFVATDKGHQIDAPAEFKQIVEGAILQSELLISFTLHTNDASSTETQKMLSALDQLRIE